MSHCKSCLKLLLTEDFRKKYSFVMNIDYEKKFFNKGYDYIAGIDEVGRGAFAGPIVAAAVVFDSSVLCKKQLIEEVKDSKALSENKREELSVLIREQSACFAIGIVDSQEIDRINIGNANRLCIKRAVQQLKITPRFIVCDFVQKLEFNIPFEMYAKADANILSVASASIVAKVFRDNLMKEYSKQYPEFEFEKHKGYGTSEHRSLIYQHGLCILHRRSFGVGQKKLF